MNNFFKRINDLLNTIEDTTNEVYADLEASKISLASQTDANPYPKSEYDEMFSNLESRESTMAEYVLKLTKSKEHIERIINKFNDSSSLVQEIKATINNQNLSSGFQGNLKQRIREQANYRDIINTMSEAVAEILSSDKYHYAPTKRGGTKMQKKYKKNTKRKTLKKAYKH